MQISVSDADFLDSYGIDAISDIAEGSGFSKINDLVGDMGNALSISKNAGKNLTDVCNYIKEYSKNEKLLKFVKDADFSFLTENELTQVSDKIGNVGNVLSLVNTAFDIVEVSQRSKSWGQEFINEISILTNFDDYGYNRVVSDRIKNVSKGLIDEYRNPILAASQEAAMKAEALILSEIFNKSVFGTCFAVMNGGLAMLKRNENIKNSIDSADLAYMVGCLVQVETVSANEMKKSYFGGYTDALNGTVTMDKINRLRNTTMLTLKTNLRNQGFLYYLNSRLNDDENWFRSEQAENIRKKINEDYAMICELMLTKNSDELLILEDFDSMYSNQFGKIREIIDTSIFTEGEADDIFKAVSDIYMALLNEKGYMQDKIAHQVADVYTKEYAIFDTNQDGVPELIINSFLQNNSAEQEQSYNEPLIFTYDIINRELKYITTLYGYGKIGYSSEYKAMVYQKEKNIYSFMILKNDELVDISFDEDNLSNIENISYTPLPYPEQKKEEETQPKPEISNANYEMRSELIEFNLTDGTKYYYNQVDYPYFLGNSKAECTINQYFADTIAEFKANDTDFEKMYQSDLKYGEELHLPYYDKIKAEVIYNKNGVISIKKTATMWGGGAYPYSGMGGLTYNLDTGNEIKASDILKGSDDEINQVLTKYGETGMHLIPTLDTPFVLCETGLCFYINSGSSVGAVKVIIPFTSEDSYIISVDKLL